MKNKNVKKHVTIINDEKTKAVINTTTEVKDGSIVFSLDSVFAKLGIDPKELKNRL